MDFTATSKALVRQFSINLYWINAKGSREEAYRKEMEAAMTRLARAKEVASNAEAETRKLEKRLKRSRSHAERGSAKENEPGVAVARKRQRVAPKPVSGASARSKNDGDKPWSSLHDALDRMEVSMVTHAR
ncbi:hypothetical protein EDD85DRAFT_1021858 [Armillaria nabsnona]|nr:hypothetical protein EDD85DRAFT_1021858 [Armillaria nabsnona]